MGRIFLNYRREDAAAEAGRLYDHLCLAFGADQIFMDVDALEPGTDFVKVLNEKVASCDVMIAVIGKTWVTARDSRNVVRLSNSNDFVRIEIEAALKRDIRVVPVLVGGAEMPTTEQLPKGLKAFARRHAVELSNSRFRADANKLIRSLERYLRPDQNTGEPAKTARSVEDIETLFEAPATVVPRPAPVTVQVVSQDNLDLTANSLEDKNRLLSDAQASDHRTELASPTDESRNFDHQLPDGAYSTSFASRSGTNSVYETGLDQPKTTDTKSPNYPDSQAYKRKYTWLDWGAVGIGLTGSILMALITASEFRSGIVEWENFVVFANAQIVFAVLIPMLIFVIRKHIEPIIVSWLWLGFLPLGIVLYEPTRVEGAWITGLSIVFIAGVIFIVRRGKELVVSEFCVYCTGGMFLGAWIVKFFIFPDGFAGLFIGGGLVLAISLSFLYWKRRSPE